MRTRIAVSVFLTVALFTTTAAHAQWQPDGTPVCTAATSQSGPVIISDGVGGAFMTWHDIRSGNNDIYVQRIDTFGAVQWTADGVALCSAVNSQSDPTITSDGSGGAIVAWHDNRNLPTYIIYAQRVNAMGVPQWAANGVPVTNVATDQAYPFLVSDGFGGAIVAWEDYRIIDGDIYVQRVNASGVPQWTAGGVPLSTALDWQGLITIVADGSGGAIVGWNDLRNGVNYDVYIRAVSSTGIPQWTANGVALCTETNNQGALKIVSDGAGGAIASWEDARSGFNDIYAQRVNAAGTPQWIANGVVVSAAAGNQSSPAILADGSGGAMIAWNDYRNGEWDVYAQRVNASGTPQWTGGGSAVSAAVSDQVAAAIVSDGAGGMIVAWSDYRNLFDYDVYAQRVTASGAPQWASNGVALSTAVNPQYGPVVASGGGGAIVAWQDNRSGEGDVYALRIDERYGHWGHPEPNVMSVADIPNDQGGKVAVNWAASGRDLIVPATIDYYSIWRAVDVAPLGPGTAAPSVLTAIASVGPVFQSQVFTTIPSSSYYWELIGTQTAFRWTHYSFSAETRADSVAGDAGTTYFMVAAHDVSDEHIAFASDAMSGHSVDNLAPAAPLLLTAQRVGSDVNLQWNRAVAPDLRDYSIYRATSSGVTPVPINFLSSSEDTVAVDASAPTTALYYIVTALDVHANQSPPSNEAGVGALTSVGNTPPISALTVLDNVPNPFAGATTLRVGLAKPSEVEIEVFDVAGRSVRSERTATLAAGWREISFEARDAAGISLPSGVYFYRVKGAGETITRKMVIAR